MRKLRVPQYVPDASNTKSRILLESARMFALSGYTTVSVRDIANVIGIQASSIYNHFNSKRDILESMMKMCEDELIAYYDMCERMSMEARSFSTLLRNLFAESVEVVNPFIYYALYTASTTQYEFELSRRCYYDCYLQKGHQVTCRQLEIATERGLVEPFDTEAVSSLIMNCILNMVNITVGRMNGYYKEFDIHHWYDLTINHILQITNSAEEIS